MQARSRVALLILVTILCCCRSLAQPAGGFEVPADFGTSVTETMRVLLEEPNFAAQSALVHGYLADLPREGFREALDALGRFEGRQVSSYLGPLLKSWA